MHYSVKTASKLSKQYQTNDPFHLCERLNISITLSELPEHLKGFYIKVFDIPFIFIQQSLPEQEQRGICAHELGHAILHPDLNTLFLKQKTLLSSEKLELEADLFAAQLLIPEPLKQYCLEGESVEQLSFQLNVPQKYIAIKKNCIG